MRVSNPLFLLLLAFTVLSASNLSAAGSVATKSKIVYVKQIHRIDLGTYGKSALKIWIVDGLKVRQELYPEFVYGGNAQRYPFIPRDEIWIDNAISSEEFSYTVSHELYERELMAKKGLSYGDAHDSALHLEHRMRMHNLAASAVHEAALGFVSPLDCDSVRELPLPDSIKLSGIYREFLGTREGISIWIVDGEAIRQHIYPDFGFSGNDEVYYFIPKREIWIDNAVSCEETEFSINEELRVREGIARGQSYDSAYDAAILKSINARAREKKKNLHYPPMRVDLKFPDRDFGTGDEKGLVRIPESIDSVEILKRKH